MKGRKRRTSKPRRTVPRRTLRRAGGKLPSYPPSWTGGESTHGKHVGQLSEKPHEHPHLGRQLMSRASPSLSLSLSLSFDIRTIPWQIRLHTFLVQDDLHEIKGGTAAPAAHDLGRIAKTCWLVGPLSPLLPPVKLAAGLAHARAARAYIDTS